MLAPCCTSALDPKTCKASVGQILFHIQKTRYQSRSEALQLQTGSQGGWYNEEMRLIYLISRRGSAFDVYRAGNTRSLSPITMACIASQGCPQSLRLEWLESLSVSRDRREAS
jgi:hypothetical protein